VQFGDDLSLHAGSHRRRSVVANRYAAPSISVTRAWLIITKARNRRPRSAAFWTLAAEPPHSSRH